MKKLSLSIPEPCHEDWNAMTAQDKGRFCASCQKTVIDFSNMSDRQLAEFFKKPTGQVCGRFHQDQLHRDITIPTKRLPWAQALFQYTWPAFVLFLKSCREETKPMIGKVASQEERTAPKRDESYEVVGMLLSDITPVDSTAHFKQITESERIPPRKNLPLVKMGEVLLPENDTIGKDSQLVLSDSAVSENPKETQAMDTVAVCSQNNYVKGRMVAGAVSVVTHRQLSEFSLPAKQFDALTSEYKVYPNPVRAGAQLTISLPAKVAIKQYQLIASSGALVRVEKTAASIGRNLSLNLPANLAQGSYFLRLVTTDNQVKTVSLIVIN